jgi:hypothetical protein
MHPILLAFAGGIAVNNVGAVMKKLFGLDNVDISNPASAQKIELVLAHLLHVATLRDPVQYCTYMGVAVSTISGGRVHIIAQDLIKELREAVLFDEKKRGVVRGDLESLDSDARSRAHLVAAQVFEKQHTPAHAGLGLDTQAGWDEIREIFGSGIDLFKSLRHSEIYNHSRKITALCLAGSLFSDKLFENHKWFHKRLFEGVDAKKMDPIDMMDEVLDLVRIVFDAVTFCVQTGSTTPLLGRLDNSKRVDDEYALLKSFVPCFLNGTLEQVSSAVRGGRDFMTDDMFIARLAKLQVDVKNLHKISRDAERALLTARLHDVNKWQAEVTEWILRSPRRTEPFAFCLRGPTAQGKTVLCSLMVKQLLQACGYPYDDRVVALVDCASKYMDTVFNHTKAIIFDDVANMAKDTNPNAIQELMMVMDAIGTAAKPVPKADLDSKGSTILRAAIIALTTNSQDLNCSLSNEPSSLLRRAKYFIDMETLPQYSRTFDDSTVAGLNGGSTLPMVDPSKLDAGLYTQHQRFTITTYVAYGRSDARNAKDNGACHVMKYRDGREMKGLKFWEMMEVLVPLARSHFVGQAQLKAAMDIESVQPLCPHGCTTAGFCGRCNPQGDDLMRVQAGDPITDWFLPASPPSTVADEFSQSGFTAVDEPMGESTHSDATSVSTVSMGSFHQRAMSRAKSWWESATIAPPPPEAPAVLGWLKAWSNGKYDIERVVYTHYDAVMMAILTVAPATSMLFMSVMQAIGYHALFTCFSGLCVFVFTGVTLVRNIRGWAVARIAGASLEDLKKRTKQMIESSFGVVVTFLIALAAAKVVYNVTIRDPRRRKEKEFQDTLFEDLPKCDCCSKAKRCVLRSDARGADDSVDLLLKKELAKHWTSAEKAAYLATDAAARTEEDKEFAQWLENNKDDVKMANLHKRYLAELAVLDKKFGWEPGKGAFLAGLEPCELEVQGSCQSSAALVGGAEPDPRIRENPWERRDLAVCYHVDGSVRNMTAEQVYAKVSRQVYVMKIVYDNIRTVTSNCLIVATDYMVAPAHNFIGTDGEFSKITAIELTSTGQSRGPTFTVKFSPRQTFRLAGDDLLVQINAGGTMPNIFDLLAIDHPKGQYPVRELYRDPNDFQIKESSYMVTSEIVHCSSHGMVYNGCSYNRPSPTFKGLCGAVLVADARFPQIVGFHTMGREGETKGVACYLNRKDIIDGIAELRKTALLSGPVVTQNSMAPHVPPGMEHMAEVGPLYDRSIIREAPEGTAIIPVGTMVNVPNVRATSTIELSPITGLVESVCGQMRMHEPPMNLGKATVEAAKVKEMHGRQSVNPDDLALAKECLTRELVGLVEATAFNGYLHVLSMDEATSGVAHCSTVRGINRSTAPGFPYTGTKHRFLDLSPRDGLPDAFVLKPEVKAEVEECISRMEKLERVNMVHKCVHKCEAVKKGKLKVRVIEGSPLVMTIITRMYFMPIIRLFLLARHMTGSSVGIDATSMEWDDLYHHLVAYNSTWAIVGDWIHFDTSQVYQEMMVLFGILIFVCESCGTFSEADINVMWVVAQEICRHYTLLKTDLAITEGTNVSGGALTVYINNGINDLRMRSAFYGRARCLRDLPPVTLWRHDEVKFTTGGLPIIKNGREGFQPLLPNLKGSFLDYVRPTYYGDDFILVAKPEITGWFNQLTLADYFAKEGLHLTDADKKAFTDPATRWEDVTFLKRHFRHDTTTNCVMAPLAMDSIYKPLHVWPKKLVWAPHVHAAQLLDGVMRELLQHGRAVFEEKAPLVLELARRYHGALDLMAMKHVSYHDMVNEWFGKEMRAGALRLAGRAPTE